MLYCLIRTLRPSEVLTEAGIGKYSYSMNFIFRKLFSKIPPEKEAEHLVKTVCGSAYSVFVDTQFRELSKFEEFDKEEQNRIFNELIVTAILLLVSVIEDNIMTINLDRRIFWQKVCRIAPDYLVDWLKELGIEERYLDIWRDLIRMRLDEYKERKFLTRSVFGEEIIKNDEEESLNDSLVRVETLTISGLLYITRCKAKPGDNLQKHLRTWLGVLNGKIESRIGW